jgi:hypothetical protein
VVCHDPAEEKRQREHRNKLVVQLEAELTSMQHSPTGHSKKACALVERIAEIRAGDTWRNLADQLDRIKVGEYEHNGARVRQTNEIDRELAALLVKLGVPLPPELHTVAAVAAATPAA